MYAQISGNQGDFHGAAYQSFFQGSPELILDNLSKVIPELECNPEELSSNSYSLFNIHCEKNRIFKGVEVIMNIEKSPSFFFPTKRFLGINYARKPFHGFEILVYSERKDSLYKAIAEFTERKQDLMVKSPRITLEEKNLANSFLKTRLESFCLRTYNS